MPEFFRGFALLARRDFFQHRGLRIPEPQRQSASALDTAPGLLLPHSAPAHP